MKSAGLPSEKAFEPDEKAHQPSIRNMPADSGKNKSKKPKLTFAKNTTLPETPHSQTSNYYKDVLSQPAPSLSHEQKLLWLQKRRKTGLWAQCDKCDHWRYLPHIIDRHELPEKWFCPMNPDRDYASCTVPEAPLRLREEEDLIHSEYTAGSIVWARLTGWPWWPAMVDDCPDTEQFYWLDGFSDIPTHYNVVFFDSLEVTRAWVSPENLKPYASYKSSFNYLIENKKYSFRIRQAMSQADEADSLTLENRLEKFCFLNRHKGNIMTPKKVNSNDLKKYQKYMKKKFNVEFPIVNSDSEEDAPLDNENVISGTPKRARNETCKTGVRKLTNDIEKIDDLIIVVGKEQMLTKAKKSNKTAKESTESNKPPNSMAVQIGSTEATIIDNATSASYITEGSEDQVRSFRMDTPNSDDFDF